MYNCQLNGGKLWRGTKGTLLEVVVKVDARGSEVGMDQKLRKFIPKEREFVLCGPYASPLERIIKDNGFHPNPTTNYAFALTPPKEVVLTKGVTSRVPYILPMFSYEHTIMMDHSNQEY